jgi:ribosomal protein S18 acetylase RimI-like enzyme
MITVRPADETEHGEILQISKQSPYTRDFSNRMMFSSKASYDAGWIVVARREESIVGFYCIRIKKRSLATSLYFIGVGRDHRRLGIGNILMQNLISRTDCSGRELWLNVSKSNEPAKQMYDLLGFEVVGEGIGGTAWKMVRVPQRVSPSSSA